jgi:hypothetical protein
VATSSTRKKGGEITLDRRSGEKRRAEEDRRTKPTPVAENRREGDRRKVQRRRQIDPTTCERDYTDEEIEFMQAMDAYKRASGRMFPTCSEILEVVKSLGYAQAVAAPDAPLPPAVSDAAAAGAAADPETVS